MLREVLHSKIHMARLTAAHPDYVGSITIDSDLLDACGMRVNDKVLIANCRNGARFETYIFRGKPGSGCFELNGAVARLGEIGDKLIIMHFALMDDHEYINHRPKVLIMGQENQLLEVTHYEPQAILPTADDTKMVKRAKPSTTGKPKAARKKPSAKR
jgi:aspartate 1-decarboxylase